MTKKPTLFPQGIYIGLPEDAYHTDAALGSSDLKRLWQSPCDFWYSSSMNPLRPSVKATKAQMMGRAIHKFVLEGKEAFEDRYVRRPDGVRKMTTVLRQELTSGGEEILLGHDYDRAVIAGAMIRANPELASAFQDGISEVSIFVDLKHEGMPIRMKGRPDYLKYGGIGDLKSCANPLRRDFRQACFFSFANYRNDIQAAHYLDLLTYLPGFLAKDWVFFGTKLSAEEKKRTRALLDTIATNPKPGFQWIFYQTDGAPIVFPYKISPRNPMLTDTRRDIKGALDNYKTYMDRFGPDSIWILTEETKEAHYDDLPMSFGRR